MDKQERINTLPAFIRGVLASGEDVDPSTKLLVIEQEIKEIEAMKE